MSNRDTLVFWIDVYPSSMQIHYAGTLPRCQWHILEILPVIYGQQINPGGGGKAPVPPTPTSPRYDLP